MPIYDFKCKTCGIVEINVSMMLIREKMQCPECGRVARRVFQAPVISFNRWNPEYNTGEMDGEMEATAAGFNE